MDLSSLGVGELVGISAALIPITVAVVNWIKRLLRWKWADRIPDAVWIVLSVAIPVGICWAAHLNWFRPLTVALPPELGAVPSASTGLLIGLGAQAAYTAKKAAMALVAAKVPTLAPVLLQTPIPEAPMSESTPVVAPEPAQMPVAATAAEIPTPLPDTQEACAVTAEVLYRKDGSEAAVELTGPTGKRRLVFLK